jgi:hypothetical protein
MREFVSYLIPLPQACDTTAAVVPGPDLSLSAASQAPLDSARSSPACHLDSGRRGGDIASDLSSPDVEVQELEAPGDAAMSASPAKGLPPFNRALSPSRSYGLESSAI